MIPARTSVNMLNDPLRPALEAVLRAWAKRVSANREQVARCREAAERADHYAPIAGDFRADPRRENDPVLEALAPLIDPGDIWLDIGTGGGRLALPVALRAREVIALDPSAGMLAVLRDGMAEHGIANVRIVQDRWPSANPPRADVALISHVGYDIEAIGPFLDGMEAAARRLCIAVLFWRRPTWAADALWPDVHGEARVALPALPEFITVQNARGRMSAIRTVEAPPISYESFDRALGFARIQTWVVPDGDKDRRLQALLRDRLTDRDGRLAFDWNPVPVGIVTWRPDARIPPG
jgi:SAM-dependent methyltransferase